MKKGYYIHFQGRASIGISKKLDMQIEEFKKHFDFEEIEVETTPRSLLQRVLGLLPWMSIARGYDDAFKKLDNPDFIYVRRTVAEKKYVDFFKRIKEKFPNCKIIIEIFTYPYDKDDFGRWDAWPFYLKETIYRKKLKKYVDRYVIYTDDKEVFGVPTINTTNGINVERVKVVEGEYEDDSISLVAVAFMQRHHGYERLIEGLRIYQEQKEKSYKITLHLVGDGPEKVKYQNLIEQYKLQDCVKMYATKSGEELDELYNKSDIALASFGMYRLGIYGKVMVLKSRECLAKGMPMLSGSEIDVIEDGFPYVKTFANDDSPVDMNEVVAFYENIRETGYTKSEVAEKIREYAKAHVSMEQVMSPIVQYIES